MLSLISLETETIDSNKFGKSGTQRNIYSPVIHLKIKQTDGLIIVHTQHHHTM